VHADDSEWDELLSLFPPIKGARNIFVLDIDLVQTSCGFGVPLFAFTDDRELMDSWATKKGPDGIQRYQQEKNLVSLDGFPTGLPT